MFYNLNGEIHNLFSQIDMVFLNMDKRLIKIDNLPSNNDTRNLKIHSAD